jgi:hypothetical protein
MAGAFTPANKTMLFRFNPHGVHSERWVENPKTWSGDETKSLFADITDSTCLAENGWTQGVVIDTATNNMPIRFHLTCYSRVIPSPLNNVSGSTEPERVATTMSPANPNLTSKISLAAAQLAKNARETGMALMTTHSQVSNTKDSLLDALEKGAVGGAAVAGVTGAARYIPKLVGSSVMSTALNIVEELGGAAAFL